jgi:lipopolysaccharide biosynthesis glycosyltransferase
MARLWIADLLDPEVDRFLYLDGDVEVTAPLDPLLAMPLPPGGFLAAPDVTWLIRGRWGNLARSKLPYLDALGVPADAYFNAGVLLAERAGFHAIGRAARDFFLRSPELCRCQDQSALNAVGRHLRGELSLNWNYQTEFMVTADPRRWNCTPAIWHYTGFPKPWQAKLFPWVGEEFGRSFRIGAELLAQAGVAAPPPDPVQIEGARRQREGLRRRIQWLHGWRRLARERKVRAAMTADAA